MKSGHYVVILKWSADSGTFDAIDGAFYPCCDDIREEHIERCKELWNYDPTDEEE